MTDLDSAIQIIKEGGIVIFPTDTAYGMGCRIDSEKTVKHLFNLRRRPETQPVPVLVNSPQMAEKYFLSPLPDNVRHLLEKHWPGALTVVYYCQTERVSSLVRGRGKTVGIRMPNHDLTLALIAGVGLPILGPSANFHGKPTPFHFEELDPELIKKVDFVLRGRNLGTNVSTVLDCTVSPWKVIRKGVVKIKKNQEKLS